MTGGAWTALVLAAARPQDPLARAAGLKSPLLLDVGGGTLLARALAALRASPTVGRIVVATDDARLLDGLDPRPEAAQAAAGPVATVRAAFRQLGPPLLVVDLDKPFIRQADVEAFIAALAESEAAAGLAVVPAALLAAGAPGAAPATVAFADGAYAGAGLYGLASGVAEQALTQLDKLDWAAASLGAAVRAIDPWGAVLLATRRLTLARAAERLSSRIAAAVVAIPLARGEAALDLRDATAAARFLPAAVPGGPKALPDRTDDC